MRFFVRHETLYRYSVPVELATHLVRLNPRAEGTQLVARTLDVQPWPVSRMERVDPFGNSVTELGFRGISSELRIQSRFELLTFAPPSLPQWQRPLPWPTDIYDGLAAYRIDAVADTSVAQFAAQLALEVGHDAVAFLDRLAQTLSSNADHQLRVSGDAQPAAATLASWQGSCRDLTVLFMAACRSQGMASRFTSGYLAPNDDLDGPREMHAWAEVYLPGGGWRGWDPTLGRRVHDGYVPLCAAPTQNGAMPVEGGYSFVGSILTTTLDFDLRISVHRYG